jgi:uncharacterized membrane protein
MAKWLAVASLVWPTMLGLATAERITFRAGPVTGAAVVYAMASRVCHQKPERSFHTAGVAWPVCARCSGLYAAAPLGAFAALLMRRRAWARSRMLTWLGVACAPSLITFAAEFPGLITTTNMVRFVAALPAGLMLAVTIVRTAAGAPDAIE